VLYVVNILLRIGTCSGECHDKLHNLQVGKNNRKNKSAAVADKKVI